MLPGPDLAWYIGQVRQAGLSALSDDELIGVLNGARRLSSWQAGLELAAVAELDARRAGPGGREGEHVAEELAAALTLTGRSAGALLELARRLERLPQTTALLAAGVIDRSGAAVIADQLSLLDGDAAAAVEDRIAPRAGQLTTGQLAAACQRAVLAHDPQAAARRKDRAEKQARVECWAEPAGTGAIAGRDLNLAAVIAADKHLDAAARWLTQHGAPGPVDQLRAQAFLARLTGQPLGSLLPVAPDTARGDRPASFAPGSSAPGSSAPGQQRTRRPPGPGRARRPSLARRAGRPDRDGEPGPARHHLARPGRRPRRDRRDRRRRRRDLPRPGHRPRRSACLALVPNPHRPQRPHRRPRLRPSRPGPARRRRQPAFLAVPDRHHSPGNRDLRSPPPDRRLPAAALATPPDQDQGPAVWLPRLPPPRRALR
jgi:Domain of unknown function (DUF222)